MIIGCTSMAILPMAFVHSYMHAIAVISLFGIILEEASRPTWLSFCFRARPTRSFSKVSSLFGRWSGASFLLAKKMCAWIRPIGLWIVSLSRVFRRESASLALERQGGAFEKGITNVCFGDSFSISLDEFLLNCAGLPGTGNYDPPL
jgi:hypothetical protein